MKLKARERDFKKRRANIEEPVYYISRILFGYV